MWTLDFELEAWFDAVEEKRNQKYGGSNSADETVPLMSNELAKDRRG